MVMSSELSNPAAFFSRMIRMKSFGVTPDIPFTFAKKLERPIQSSCAKKSTVK